MNVLIAEDDPVVALGLTERLRSLGHNPIGPVSNGEQAVAEAKASLPDLYLFDIEMPNLDGLAAAVQLAGEGYRRPVVIVTGVDDPSLVERSITSKRRQRVPHQADRHARARRGAQAGRRAPRRIRGARGRGRQGPAGARGPQGRRACQRALDVGAPTLRARRLPPTPDNRARTESAAGRSRTPHRRATEPARAEAQRLTAGAAPTNQWRGPASVSTRPTRATCAVE